MIDERIALDYARAMGDVSARLTQIEKRMDRMDQNLSEVRDVIVENRGARRLGWSLLTLVGVIGGFVGAFLHFLLEKRIF